MATSPDLTLWRKYFNGEGMSDETESLVSTLPREKGWITKHIYQYEGSWYAAKPLQGLVASQRHFQAKDKDIILATSPKCGTTWLKAISFALVNRQTLDVDHGHPLLTSNPHSLVPFLELKLYWETNKLPDLSSFASPRIFGTHAPIGSLPRSINDNPSCKIVYMCRNPKDTFVSLWHFCNKLRPEEEGPNELEDLFNRFCNGTSHFGPFWDHVLGYWKESLESPHKVLFLKYEEMKEQPADQLRRLAEFLECPFSSEEEIRGTVDDILKLCSFDELSNLEVNKTALLPMGRPHSILFRKGEVGDWVNHLTPEMAEKLDRITELKMRGSHFKF